MPQELSSYFEHGADIGIIGRGTTMEHSFEDAAKATFGIMTDLAVVQPRQAVQIRFDESDVEMALVTWLNLLLGTARERGLVLSRFQLARENGHWVGTAWGQPWSHEMERGVEVKGATLTCLSVKNIHGVWDARCIADV